ncbi:TrkH family potassium uptake protein [Arcanobacterium haemolyticum]|nr:TrkH family potassium uptake protein [Arcanobacterium haemolyticum]
MTIVVFTTIILFFTSLLQLPVATATGHRAPLTDAFFTAVSSVCVTGLVTVDTATYWSPIGHFCIAIAMMVGGLGIMTLASIVGLSVSRHIGLTQTYLTARETQAGLGEVGSLVRAVLVVSLSAQTVLFVVLTPFFLKGDDPLLTAFWHSFFMAVSIFNNGGFVILPEGLQPHVGDWTLTLPIVLGTFVGAIGFPVILDLWRNRHRRAAKWNLTTKITIVTYISLFLFGAVCIGALEFGNPDTFGPLSLADKINAAFLQSASARSTGLATVDIGSMNESSQFVLDALMFIGGGSASAAGGIKVTTLAVLILAIVAEARGDQDTEAFGRRIPSDVLRLAIAATSLGAITVGTGTIVLLHITQLPLSDVLFEVISAFATCGLSTGITAALPASAKWVLIVLMVVGRIGTMSLAGALALRSRQRVIRMPEERPTIG